MEDVEYETVQGAIESVVSELRAALEAWHAKATADALEIYYAAKELARDAAHPEHIARVKAMRHVYEQEFGRPIPPAATSPYQRSHLSVGLDDRYCWREVGRAKLTLGGRKTMVTD